MRFLRFARPGAPPGSELTVHYFKRILNHFVIILFSLLVHERHALLDYQQITIYSDNCCKGKNESFRTNSRDFASVSSIISNSQMKSFSVNRGLWALSPETNYSTIGIIRVGLDKEGGDARDESSFSILGSCSSTARGNGEYTQYRSIRHIGNTFVNLPGLSLFTNVNHFGEELYFDGTFLKLPSILQFKSYGFTPKGVSWTIFSDLNYTGNSTCLKSQDKTVTSILTKRDFHKQHQHHRKRATGNNGGDNGKVGDKDKEQDEEEKTVFKIGSIKRGCIKSGIKKADGGKKDKHHQNQSKIKDVLHEHQKQHQHHHINVIALHTKVNQHGTELMTDATELRLPAPHLFKSYSFIGHKNWTVYAGIEFNGAARCLFNPKSTPKATLAKFNGTAIHQSIHLMVGSLKRGCEDDPVREVITPPPKPPSTEGQTGTATVLVNQEQYFMFLILKIVLVIVTSHVVL